MSDDRRKNDQEGRGCDRRDDDRDERDHGHHGDTISGTLTVSGDGRLEVPCRGQPVEVEVSFIDDPTKMGCGPQDDDEVEIEVIRIRKPFPLWALRITWRIRGSNAREIEWTTTVR